MIEQTGINGRIHVVRFAGVAKGKANTGKKPSMGATGTSAFSDPCPNCTKSYGSMSAKFACSCGTKTARL